MPLAVDTSGRIYDDFSRLLFLHAHREASTLSNELPEESGQFRFLRAACLTNLKGSVGLLFAEVINFHLSSTEKKRKNEVNPRVHVSSHRHSYISLLFISRFID